MLHKPRRKEQRVLNQFAGATSQLQSGAILVNPSDVTGVADAIHEGVLMKRPDRQHRMRMSAVRRGSRISVSGRGIPPVGGRFQRKDCRPRAVTILRFWTRLLPRNREDQLGIGNGATIYISSLRKYPARIIGYKLDTRCVVDVRATSSAIVGADRLLHIAIKLVEQLPEEQASVGG